MSVANIEYAYGFGVYETLRVVGGKPRFLADHLARLEKSAQIIGLEHAITLGELQLWIQQLLQAESIDVCNLKILLIGGRTAADAQLYILPLAPLFPDRKLYRDGVATITQHFERPWPQAKTLSMLGSYLAYRQARRANCYDALLISWLSRAVPLFRLRLPKCSMVLYVVMLSLSQMAWAFAIAKRQLWPMH